MVYLYSLEGCNACAWLEENLSSTGTEFKKVMIDSPLLELGVQVLFKDGKVHAPVLVRPQDGIYILSESEPRQLLKIHDLKEKTA